MWEKKFLKIWNNKKSNSLKIVNEILFPNNYKFNE